jgi:hypothetical protein
LLIPEHVIKHVLVSEPTGSSLLIADHVIKHVLVSEPIGSLLLIPEHVIKLVLVSEPTGSSLLIAEHVIKHVQSAISHLIYVFWVPGLSVYVNTVGSSFAGVGGRGGLRVG